MCWGVLKLKFAQLSSAQLAEHSKAELNRASEKDTGCFVDLSPLRHASIPVLGAVEGGSPGLG